MKARVLIFIGFVVFLLVLTVYLLRKSLFGRNAMVIVEPRDHKFLETTIKNFDRIMDSSWDLYVFHAASSQDYAKEAVRAITKRSVFLKPLETDNLNADEYNTLFKKAEFWSQVDAENILVFQTDAALCGNSSFRINDFTKYDYIGCAINNKSVGRESPIDYWGPHNFYGVGGLSFRRKSFMMKCIADNPGVPDGFAEDVFFSNCLEASPRKPKDATVINEFCTQNNFNVKSFGIHKTSVMNSMHKQALHEYCPEARDIDQ